MRTGVALLAAVLLAAGCSNSDAGDASGEDPIEQPTRDVEFASGSLTVGNPRINTTPAVELPSVVPGETTPATAGTFSLDDVRLEDGAAVFSFGGDGVVNYVARYVDEAVLYGTTAAIDVAGRSILQLDLITDPSADTTPATGPALQQSGSDGIVDVHTAEASEGVSQAFIGIASDRPKFTIHTHPDPPSLTVAIIGAA